MRMMDIIREDGIESVLSTTVFLLTMLEDVISVGNGTGLSEQGDD